jgi:hypothetical protein
MRTPKMPLANFAAHACSFSEAIWKDLSGSHFRAADGFMLGLDCHRQIRKAQTETNNELKTENCYPRLQFGQLPPGNFLYGLKRIHLWGFLASGSQEAEPRLSRTFFEEIQEGYNR